MSASRENLRKTGASVAFIATLATLGACSGPPNRFPPPATPLLHPAEDAYDPKTLGDIFDHYNEFADPGEDWTDTSSELSYNLGELYVEFIDGDAVHAATPFRAKCVGTTLVTELFDDVSSRVDNPRHPACADSLPGPGVLHAVTPEDNILQDRNVLVQLPGTYTPVHER